MSGGSESLFQDWDWQRGLVTEDIKSLRFASEKKFAEIWKEDKDDVWESNL